MYQLNFGGGGGRPKEAGNLPRCRKENKFRRLDVRFGCLIG